jgi:signal transduction histidine kinase
LIYDVVVRFQDEITQRGVSCEINLDPSIDQVLVDRLKLREVISETIRNALAGLPKQGGRLGVRTSGGHRKNYIAIEIADNGRGMDTRSLNELLDENPFGIDRRSQTGLALTIAVAKQHGGQLDIIIHID